MVYKASKFPVLFCMLAVMLFAITGCTALPKPFQSTDLMPPNQLVVDGASDGVEIEIIEGPALPMANLLSGAVASELGKQGVPAVVGLKGNSRFILKGRAVRVVDEPESPYVVKIHWKLRQNSGAVIGEYVQGVEGDEWEWDYGSPKIVQETGLITATMVVEMINMELQNKQQMQISAPQDTLAIRQQNIKPEVVDFKSLKNVIDAAGIDPEVEVTNKTAIWIAPVVGAPSDGNIQLTDSIKKVIRSSGVLVVRDKAASSHTLQGTVKLAPIAEDVKSIVIIWALLQKDGSEFGRATQRNNIPSIMLKGTWSKLASVISRAARSGIVDVIEKSKQTGTTVGINKTGLVIVPVTDEPDIVLPLPSLDIE